MNKIWIAAYSYDWEDAFAKFKDLSLLETFLRESFEIPDTIPAWTTEFWAALTDAYNNAAWKSFQVLEVNLTTGKVKNFRRPETPT